LFVLLTGLVWLHPWQQTAPAAAIPPNPAAMATVTPTVVVATPAPLVQAPAQPSVPQTKPAPVAKTEAPKKAKPIIAATAPAPTNSAPAAVEAKAPVKEPTVTEVASDDDSVGTIRNLPRTIQAEVPAIVVNGYIYAKNPIDRSVLINQKLLHEGDQIAPELVLEKMLPKGAILNYKGYRYRVAF
jgi:general secretion pathway protein B